MTAFLRKSTAGQIRSIGPFVDDTDGKTAETGLTIANTDIKLMLNGGASVNKSSGGATHRSNGHYGITFDATDTVAVGELLVSVSVAGALPVWGRFFVLTEAAYDTLFATSAPGALTAAGVRSALGLAAANLDTQLADLPTVAEFEARTLPSADYLIVGDMPANFAGLGINASGHIERVVLVDTTTTNTDMRGTDSGATAAALALVATEVGKIPRGTAAVDAGPFTMKVTNGAAITGGQSVTAEYE